MEGGKGGDVLLEMVATISGKLANERGGGDDVVVESLHELQGVHMTFEVLEATKIGHAVNALRKTAPSEQARRLAAALYRGWKALADERFSSSIRTQQTKADEGIKKSSSPPSVLPPPKLSAGGPEADRETIVAPASGVLVEAAATPQTKLHLDEGLGLDTAAIVVRKPLTLRVISTNATGKAEHLRVTVVQCSTAAIPAEPTPAPVSETATRNGGGVSKSNQQANSPSTTASHHQGTNNAAAKPVRVSPPLTTTANKPPTALPTKPVVGSLGARKRKAEDSRVFDEARLAKARTRLQDAYKAASIAKEKRKPKEINAIDELRKKARQQHPSRRVRCTAALGTAKRRSML